MNSCFSIDSSSELIHGDYFSVFVNGKDSYWVVSNEFKSAFTGPNDLGTALKLMSYSNKFFNILKLKGLFLL